MCLEWRDVCIQNDERPIFYMIVVTVGYYTALIRALILALSHPK